MKDKRRNAPKPKQSQLDQAMAAFDDVGGSNHPPYSGGSPDGFDLPSQSSEPETVGLEDSDLLDPGVVAAAAAGHDGGVIDEPDHSEPSDRVSRWRAGMTASKFTSTSTAGEPSYTSLRKRKGKQRRGWRNIGTSASSSSFSAGSNIVVETGSELFQIVRTVFISAVRPFLPKFFAVTIYACVVYFVFWPYVQTRACSQSILRTYVLSKEMCTLGPNPPTGEQFERATKFQEEMGKVYQMSSVADVLPSMLTLGKGSMQDLKLAVEVSNLPSKDIVVSNLNEFLEIVRSLIARLRRYNEDIERCTIQTTSINQWTREALSIIQARQFNPSKWQHIVSLGGLIDNSAKSRKAVNKVFVEYTTDLKGRMKLLMAQGEDLLRDVESLETQLYQVALHLDYDNKRLEDDKWRNSNFWSNIGLYYSNELKSVLKEVNSLPQLLGDLKAVREVVSKTAEKVAQINAGLESLREEVAAPAVQLHTEKIPIEVYLTNIDLTLERLQEWKVIAGKEKEGLRRRVEEARN